MAIADCLRLVPLVCTVATLTAGCAGAKVTNERKSAVAAAPPDVIYVGAIDLGASVARPGAGGPTGRPLLLPPLPPPPLPSLRPQRPAGDVEALQETLADELVRDLNEAGTPARRLDPAAPRPTRGWLVTGEFLQLDEGNRLRRAVIGFGAGGSEAKRHVVVADLARPEGQNLLDLEADATGNKLPGGAAAAVATRTPWGMVAKFVLDRNASEKDVKRAARAIADEIVTFVGKK